MIPGDASAHSQLVLLLIADVQSTSLRLTLSLSVTTSSSASSAEVSVVHVVGITHKRIAYIAEGLHGCQSDAIAPIRTDADIRIGLQSSSGTSLRDEFQHKVVITVVNTCQSTQVTLLVVSLYLINHIRWQVLHHCIIIACHEVTSVQLKAFHVLSVDADFTVVINLSAWQSLYECLDDRAFWYTIGVGIIHYRIILDNHLRQIGCHYGIGQLQGIRRQLYLAQRLGVAGCQRHTLFAGLIT